MVMNTIYTGNSPVTVDLVLVHDLSGDPTASWTSPVSHVVWPKHLLPLSQDARQESFRALSFGYNGNADVTGGLSPAGRNTIDENASDLLSELELARQGQPKDRPIIFVAHGYGGLIVKATLSRSRELATRITSPDMANINQATIGVVFLATPHNGSRINEWEDVETPSTGLTYKTYHVQIAADLSLGSSAVSRIARDFINVANDGLQIVSFSETLPSRLISGGSAILVAAVETRINHVNEITRSLAAKHYDMPFADNMDDPRFLSLAGEIGQMLKMFRDGTGPKKPNPTTSGTGVIPATGTGVIPATGTGVSPATGTGVSPATGTGINPTTGTGVNPTTGTGINPSTGTGVNPTPGTEPDQPDELRALYIAAFKRHDYGTAVYYSEKLLQILYRTKGFNDPETLRETKTWKALRVWYRGRAA